ncbi:MAG: VCBS repeat-containing protein [Cyclobacteriaceae bacterium]|nr:VCBS repeat-containing protein [Cyclobacteriaceae bacterium]
MRSSILLAAGLLSFFSGRTQTPGLQWARALNGTGPGVAYPESIVTDVANNVYTVGSFRNTIDANPSAGVFPLTSVGQNDIFISKLDAAGNFVWAMRLGGAGNDIANAITVDNTGKVYVTGSYTGTVDFDPGPGTTNLSGGGAFALSLDSNGTLIWAGRIGSGGGKAITIDASNNLVISGDFTGSSDFDPGPGTVVLTSVGSVDIFISKFLLNGTLVWVRQMGGSAADFCEGVDTDAANNIYTTGSFSGTADFNPGGTVDNLISAGSSDIYVSKLDAAGTYVFALRIGNTGSESANALTVDGASNVLVAGDFSGTVDFDPGASVSNLTSAGSSDIFIVKISSAGVHTWSRNMGGTSSDRPSQIITDAAGGVYTTGYFYGTSDFDPGAGVFNLVSGTGNQEAFISKLTSAGNFSWATRTESTAGGETEGVAVALDTNEDILIAGWFELIVDFDAGSCTYNLPSNGDDIFIMKLSATAIGCIPPRITGFSPADGPVGSTVIIDGVQFSPTAANNTVYFGAARAIVTAATSTSLTVTVPTGATYAPITLSVAGAIAYSQRPFVVTFPDGGVINTCSFSAPTNYSSGNFGYGLATGDLDLDGKVDIVISNPTAGTLMIFRNTSTIGSIDAASFATSVDLPAGTNVQHVVISDVDGDGKLDLVAAGFDSNIIAIYRNIATPGTLTTASFQARVDLATGARPFDVEAADLDGDGKTDIVTSTEGRLSFWRNIGTSGSLATGSFDTRQDIFINSISVAISDLDVDGKPDLIIGPALSSVARIYRNISTPGSLVPGSFAAGVDFSVGAWPDYIVTGDLDDDQRPDIITSSWPGGSISILKNTSTPGTIDATSFAPKVDIAGLTEPRGLSITDYDGDSKPDIALAMQISSNIHIYKNLSSAGTINSGSFAPVVAFPSGGNLRLVTSADFDGDGKPDLATSNWSGPPLSVLRNLQGTPSITGVAPSSGIMGSSVTITGTNFSPTPSDNVVKFNGLAATVISSTTTSITAIVPTNATTGPLTVTKNCLTATSGNFTVLPYTPPCSNLLLNGATDKVSFADDPSLEPAAVTVEAWVKVNAFTSTKSGGNTSAQFILFKRNQLTVYSEGYSFVLDESTKSFLGVVSSGAGGPPSQRILSTSANLVNLNQWYHLALTADNVEVKFFVNGELIGTLPTGFALNYGPEGLSIGNTSPLNSWQGAFNGNVDEVRIWNSVRSQSQLQSSMTAALAGTEPGLVAYYKMDETGQGAGLTVTNSASATGAINNGVTVGSATTPVFNGSCSCVPTTQRDALISLYNATDGANWSDNTGWLSADLSTWYGVTVSGCNVTDVNLAGNNLIGGIPPEIGSLTMLEGLDLGANQLNGWIPPEIGNLSALTALNLSINQLEGSVPIELSYLSNLQVLGLAFNQLGGNLPVELEFLSQLTDVYLNNNNFTGDVPLIGGGGSNMYNLLLEFNQFTGLPDLTSYSGLNAVNIHNNRLTFDDLEPIMALTSYSFSYSPQAPVPPGGIIAFIPGNDLLINFSTGGTANSYQWYKNNVLIPGATSTNLLIPNATPGDVGLYEVRITNSIVPLLTLSSMTYTVITDPCGASTPTSGDLDTSFAPLISAPSTFLGVGVQSNGKIITSTSYTIENSTIKSGVLRFNTDGSLDNSFAVNPYAGEVLVQPDNKVLVAYSDGTYAYPVRLNSDGTDDTGFNGNVSQYYSGSISAMAYQSSDNTILVAGGAYMTPPFIERLNPNGTSAGTLPDATDLYVTTIAVQSDDYILIGGQFVGGIRRLDPSGALDPSFMGDASDFVTDIVVQPDGKILVAGLFQFFNDLPHRGLVRLNPDGSIDNTFTALGITDLIDLGYYPTRLLLQSDNKIIVAGLFETINGASRRNLVRLNPDGTVDCSFDPEVSSDSVIEGLAIQSNGQILITGSFTSYESTPRYGLARINGVSASLTITLQPSDVLICDGGIATFSTAATGTTNITYQWQFSPNGIVPFTDIANGGAYSGANTSTLSINTTGMFGAGRYQCRINGDAVAQLVSNDEGLFIYAFPTAPPAVGGSACGASSVTLTSSGIPNGNYRWYTVSSGGSPIAGAFNDTYVTPVLGSTTTFYVAANNGVCESLTRTPVVATINTIPAAPTTIGGSACGPNPVLLTASGSVNGNYRWYTVATGGTAITGETNSTYATPVLLSTTTYYAAINDGTCESSARTAAIATINSLPAAPTTTGATNCPSTSMTLSASGGVNGQYRWYTVATGGTAIPGEVNDTYVTPLLTTSTTYHVAINDGICESARTPVIATINTVGKPAVVTSNCTATGAILTGPTGFTTYAWSNGASTPSINISVAGTYTLIVTTSAGCVSPPSDPTVFTAAFCNQPPVITTTSITTPVQSTVTLSVSSLTSDLDNNIDFSTLAVVVGPISGAIAFFNANNELVVDYTDIAFAGTDQLTIRVCDLAGACAQEVITIEVSGDITVYNALSPNGDGKNDVFYIQYIDALPDTKQNKVTIFDRWGSVVFEIENYDNGTRVFKGLSNSGTELPNGTYFYSLEFGSGAPKRTGFISLRR